MSSETCPNCHTETEHMSPNGMCLTCEAVQVAGWVDTIETAQELLRAILRRALQDRIHPDDLRRLLEDAIRETEDTKELRLTLAEAREIRDRNIADRNHAGLIDVKGRTYSGDGVSLRPSRIFELPPSGENYVTVKEFARLAHLSPTTVNRATAAGMPHVRWGVRTIRIVPSKAFHWLEAQRVLATTGRLAPVDED